MGEIVQFPGVGSKSIEQAAEILLPKDIALNSRSKYAVPFFIPVVIEVPENWVPDMGARVFGTQEEAIDFSNKVAECAGVFMRSSRLAPLSAMDGDIMRLLAGMIQIIDQTVK